MQLREKPLGRR